MCVSVAKARVRGDRMQIVISVLLGSCKKCELHLDFVAFWAIEMPLFWCGPSERPHLLRGVWMGGGLGGWFRWGVGSQMLREGTRIPPPTAITATLSPLTHTTCDTSPPGWHSATIVSCLLPGRVTRVRVRLHVMCGLRCHCAKVRVYTLFGCIEVPHNNLFVQTFREGRRGERCQERRRKGTNRVAFSNPFSPPTGAGPAAGAAAERHPPALRDLWAVRPDAAGQ